MQVRALRSLENSEWDNFVSYSNSGTIFHKLKFLGYHNKNKFQFLNLAFYKNGKIVAIIPGGVTDGIYKSPVGASYGSFATIVDTFNEYEEIVESFLKYSKENNFKEIYLTPPPLIYLSKQNELERFILEYKGFKVKTNLITNALDLTNIEKEGEILKVFQKRLRNDVVKSAKSSLKVEFDDNYKEFYMILLENKKKFNTLPTHTYDELLKLKKLCPEELQLLMAYYKGKAIAGTLLFTCNNTTILTFYIAHLYKYRHLKAVSRLLRDAVAWANTKNFRWFDLGVSMDTSSKNPMEPSRNLIFFKEGINSKGFLRTTYYKHL